MIQPIAAGLVHASCVVLGKRAVLIIGPSGSGKSSLALALMGLGATLVGDDQVIVERGGDFPVARVPETLAGRIEARGVGVIRADHQHQGELHLVVDLSRAEPDRLPFTRSLDVAGQNVDLIFGKNNPHLHFAIFQWLKTGICERG